MLREAVSGGVAEGWGALRQPLARKLHPTTCQGGLKVTFAHTCFFGQEVIEKQQKPRSKVPLYINWFASYSTVHWITVDITRARSVLLSWACKWVYKFGAVALQRLVESIRIINTYFNETNAGIATLLSSVDGNDADDAADGVVVADDAGATHAGSDGAFVQTMKFFHDVTATYEDILTKIGPIQRTTVFLARYDLHLERSDMHISSEIKDKMASVKVQLAFARKHLAPRMAQQAHRIESKLQVFAGHCI